MKNSTLVKGTAAIAVGAALLLGGGGTLANWNTADTANPGTIVAGDMNVKAPAGKWMAGTTDVTSQINAGTFHVVPGDTLVYTQTLSVKLVGNNMAATIGLDKSVVSNFTDKNVKIDPLKLTNSAGDVLPTTVLYPVSGSDTQTVNAATTFQFLSTTPNLEDVNAAYNLGKVTYTLQQVAKPAS
ncbi:alternate-type signal peptide domain-containing protein [Pseudarthrobacter sp. CC12]|uniref:alternate-type signal peptide domain-containing protein n=1 Tax=Pseudarthrobacter sp. CC12 TaxID=3029193 RepID=UPI0032667107